MQLLSTPDWCMAWFWHHKPPFYYFPLLYSLALGLPKLYFANLTPGVGNQQYMGGGQVSKDGVKMPRSFGYGGSFE
jgi:hypothetical protein